jgi:4-aminobutyrate--pyruvate transaminase
VICGFGRTGNAWGSQTFGLEPDILTCAKGLSSGYMPISAVMISEPIWQAMVAQSDKIGMFGHGFTYSGHPVAAAVALETLKIYDEMDIVSHVRAVAPVLQDGLRRLAEHPLVGDVRGIGLIAAVEIVKDKRTKIPFDPATMVAAEVAKRAEANGLIVRVLTGDVIAFSPPMIIETNEIEEMLRAFGRALDETWAWVRARGLSIP